MRYLKLFEDITKYEWKEISTWDMKDAYGYTIDILPFDERDKNRLSSLQFRFKTDTNFDLVNGVNTKYDYAVRKDNYYSLYIYKSDDEWYYLRIDGRPGSSSKVYKCDRLDGLMTCMKEIGIIDHINDLTRRPNVKNNYRPYPNNKIN